MKKLLVLALAVILVFSMAAVSMAAVVTSGLARFDYVTADDGISTTDDEPSTAGQIRINVDNDINDFTSAHIQLRATSSGDNEPYVYDYYGTLKPAFGTVKIGQWENDFWGDVDVLGEITDSVWMTPWAVEFAPKLDGGLRAAIWYNLALTDASTTPVHGAGALGGNAVGKGAYTASFGYSNDALNAEVAVGNLGQDANDNDIWEDSITMANVSYKFGTVKAFLHYADAGDGLKDAKNKAYKNEIIGAKATITDAFSAQVEYDLGYNEDNPAGLGLYYSAHAVDYVLYYVTAGDATTTTLRVQVNF